MYYLGPAQVARQQTQGEVCSIVPRNARVLSKELDPRPDAALDPRPVDQERQKEKFSPSLLQRQATLADSWAEGYVGGNEFEDTVAPAARQLQQSWDPEAFRVAGLQLAVLFVAMRIIRTSIHCQPKLHMFLEQPPPETEPQPALHLQGYKCFAHTLSKYARRLVVKYGMISTPRQMLRKFAAANCKPPSLA